VVRASIEAFNRGDFEEATKRAHPEIVLTRVGGFEPLRGREAVIEWMKPDVLEDQKMELLEVIPNGDCIFARVQTSARGAASGIEADALIFAAWTFEDQLATKIELYFDEADARAAAGLEA
jgi:ketosteroid isomerase-like protein